MADPLLNLPGSTGPSVDPTALNAGRDDKALADAFKLMALVINRLSARTNPPPAAPPPQPLSTEPTVQRASLARAALAAVFTGLPQIVTRAMVGKTPPTDPAERAEVLRGIRERRRRDAEDREMGGSGGLVGKAGATVSSMGRMLAARFAAVLGPLAVFGQVLEANNSGMSVLKKSMMVLAATLAPIILPVAVVVAAALVELADDLNGKLGPALTEWTRLIISMTPALLKLAQAIAHVVDTIVNKLPQAVNDNISEERKAVVLEAIRQQKTREEFERQIKNDSIYARKQNLGVVFGQTADEYLAEMVGAYDRLKPKPQPRGYITAADIDALHALRQGLSREQFTQQLKDSEDRYTGDHKWILEGLNQGKIKSYDKLKGDMGKMWDPSTFNFEEKRAADAIQKGQSRQQFSEAFDRFAVDNKFTPQDAATLKKSQLDAFDTLLKNKSAWTNPATISGTGTPAANTGAATAEGTVASPATGAALEAGASKTIGFSKDALQDVVTSLKMSLQPQAKFSQLTEVGRQVQLSALNQDPLEQRMLEINMKSLERLQDAVNELRGIRKAVDTEGADRAYDTKKGK